MTDRLAGVVTADGPARGVAVASEPPTPDGWADVPDRSVVVVGADLGPTVVGIS